MICAPLMKSPVLGLPEHQVPRLLHVVAELEADGRRLGERAVVDLERGPRLRQLLQRHVLDARVGVVQHRVAVAERAALHVLAGEADRRALGQDAGKRQLLGAGPVHGALVRGWPSIARFRSRPRSSFLWTVNPSGVASSDSFRSRSSSIGTPVCVFAARPGAAGVGNRRHEVLLGLERRQRLLEHRVVLLQQRVHGVLGQQAVLDQRRRRRARAPSGARVMARYIIGCVNAGSSPSLWPWRR